MLSSFLTPFTSSSLTLSLPDMGREFSASASTLGWVLEIFLLASVVFLLPVGKMADRIGKRKIFLWGTVLFALSSVCAFFATSMAWLLAARLLQGLAAAMIYATNMAILVLVFPLEKRGMAMGWNVSMVYVGLSLGPVLGGFFNYYFGWRSIFLFIIVCSVLCSLAILKFLKEEWLVEGAKGGDGLGALGYGLAMVLVMYGLSELLQQSWAWCALAGGLILFAIFLRHETRCEQPVLPVALLWHNRMFTLSNLAAMLNYSATFAISFLLSMYLQSVLGLSSRDAGLLLLVQPVIQAILSPKTGSLSDRYPATTLSSAGMAIIACGLLGLAFTVRARLFWPLVPILMLIGFGFALFTAPNNNAIMSSVEKRYYSMAYSLLSTMRLIGQILSVAIVTLLMSLHWDYLPASAMLVRNIEIAFFVFTALCLAGMVPSLSRRK